MKKYMTILFTLNLFFCYSQGCNEINKKIEFLYSYSNVIEDVEIPLNSDWFVEFENKKAIVVFLREKRGLVTGGIVKNNDGYQIGTPHNFGEREIEELIR